jgi:hypothetical protein
MFKRTFRRVVTAAALTTFLAVTAPIPAHAAGWGGWTGTDTLLERAWSWLASFWGTSGTAERDELSGGREKGGGTIDPNGGEADGNGILSDPTCVTDEAGICIDPNGG